MEMSFVEDAARSSQMLEIQSAIGRRMADVYGMAPREKAATVEGIVTDILAWLREWVAISKRSVFAIGGMLYWTERFWATLAPLHVTYETFDEFAKCETCLQYSSYRAWIAIYRTFIVNEGQNPRVVAEGPDKFLDVPVGKLERAVSKVRRNEMEPHQWEAFFDEQVSDREFYHTMGTTAEEDEQEKKDFVEGKAPPTVKLDDKGDLMLWRGKMAVRVGWLDMVSQDPEVRDAVDQVVKKAGLR